jgi:hypothetical protein
VSEQAQYVTNYFNQGAGKEGVKQTLLDCLETRNSRMKFLNEKWLSMNKEVAYRTELRCTNKDQIRNLDRYLDEVKHKWFNKTKVV